MDLLLARILQESTTYYERHTIET